MNTDFAKRAIIIGIVTNALSVWLLTIIALELHFLK